MKISRRWIRVCVMPVVTAASLAASVGVVAAEAPDAEVEQGRRLFMSNGCYSCHGTVGQGGERSGGPRLAPGPYPFEAFKAIVRNPPEAMPRFDATYVSDEQLRSIHRYLASIAKGPSARDIPLLQAPSP
jgi:ubiquinol-cytochrome c reductase cytochrome c subunit